MSLSKRWILYPKRFFEHLENTDGVYEIRIEFESNIYRIFCFFDEGNLVILINVFQKKTQKTPKPEIELAKRLKKQYFVDKKLNAENEKGDRKKSKNKVVSWDKHLNDKYGVRGTPTRSEFEMKAQTFILGELLKEEREKANLTQAEMAEKIGTKKSYISRIENGRANIQLSTLYRLIEQGLNRKLELIIH